MNWNEFRLSLSQMQSLAIDSTHLRATCNFLTDGLRYTDYARAKLAGHDIFGTWATCQMYEYVNIRGICCSNCTALTKQGEHAAWHVRSYGSIDAGCEFDGKPSGSDYENNFGKFGDVNMNQDHRCSFSPASTTQHWLELNMTSNFLRIHFLSQKRKLGQLKARKHLSKAKN